MHLITYDFTGTYFDWPLVPSLLVERLGNFTLMICDSFRTNTPLSLMNRHECFVSASMNDVEDKIQLKL